MASFLTNDQERDALRGLSYLQRCVYLLGLRPFMDKETQLVGSHKRRISYQSLAEEMYIDPIPGVRESGSPSKTQLRRAIAALEKAGLIAIESTSSQLIIRCLLAYCVQNKADINLSSISTDKKSSKTTENTVTSVEISQCKRDKENAQADTPLNNKYKKINNFSSKPNVLAPINDDYQPSQSVFNAFRAEEGITINKTQITLFVQHCKSKAKLSADWDAEFIKWLVFGKQLQERWSNRFVYSNKNSSTKHKNKIKKEEIFITETKQESKRKTAEIVLPNTPICFRYEDEQRYENYKNIGREGCLNVLKSYFPKRTAQQRMSIGNRNG